MSKPLLNYDAVLASVRLINDHKGINIGQRHITISTSGVVPGIEKLAREELQVTLAISLHAADNNTHNALVPINKKYRPGRRRGRRAGDGAAFPRHHQGRRQADSHAHRVRQADPPRRSSPASSTGSWVRSCSSPCWTSIRFPTSRMPSTPSSGCWTWRSREIGRASCRERV